MSKAITGLLLTILNLNALCNHVEVRHAAGNSRKRVRVINFKATYLSTTLYTNEWVLVIELLLCQIVNEAKSEEQSSLTLDNQRSQALVCATLDLQHLWMSFPIVFVAVHVDDYCTFRLQKLGSRVPSKVSCAFAWLKIMWC
ncbi:hypothetical protein IW262DRAFT_313799 [Armillaria fumosa]|nr:hypothetical protein IW262DRAFT_313799 [Armillaria fumosa]